MAGFIAKTDVNDVGKECDMSGKMPKINWLYVAGVAAALIMLYMDHIEERTFQHQPHHYLKYLIEG